MQLEVVAGDDKGASLVPGGSSSPRRPPTLVAHQSPGPLTTKSVTVGLPIDSFGPNFNLFTYKLTSRILQQAVGPQRTGLSSVLYWVRLRTYNKGRRGPTRVSPIRWKPRQQLGSRLLDRNVARR